LRYTPPDDADYEQTAPAQLERNQRLIYVTGAGGKKLRPVVIKTGITDGADTEVLDGLTDGAPVVTATLATPTSGGFGAPPPPQQTP